jgi:acetyl esterase/lipase
VESYVSAARAAAARIEPWIPRAPDGASVQSIQIGGLRGHWFGWPGQSQRRAMLYLQGGGFILGSPKTTHRDLIWRLSRACDCPILAIEYGLAPEQRYPVALEQATQAYEFLIERVGAQNMAVAGDSAGGCLALALLLHARDNQLPMPASLCLLSPQTDMTGSGESVRTNRHSDAVISADAIPLVAALYADGHPLNDPYISPVFGQYNGFPPTLLQVSMDEVFLDDSVRVAHRMREAGVEVELDRWPGVPHVWQGFGACLPEARQAIEDIGKFVRARFQLEVAARGTAIASEAGGSVPDVPSELSSPAGPAAVP